VRSAQTHPVFHRCCEANARYKMRLECARARVRSRPFCGGPSARKQSERCCQWHALSSSGPPGIFVCGCLSASSAGLVALTASKRASHSRSRSVRRFFCLFETRGLQRDLHHFLAELFDEAKRDAAAGRDKRTNVGLHHRSRTSEREIRCAHGRAHGVGAEEVSAIRSRMRTRFVQRPQRALVRFFEVGGGRAFWTARST